MIFFDFETTNTRYGTALDERNEIVMVSWCVDNGPVKNYTGPILQAAEFWNDYQTETVACAYNAKFEMHWMKRLGADIDNKKWHDPMLGEKVLLGNISLPMSMDAVAGRYGFDTKDPMIDALMKSGVCPSEMPQKRLRARCNRDVRVLRDLHCVIIGELRKRGQLHLYRNRCDFAVILTHIEANGMQLDPKRVRAQYDKYSCIVGELSRQLDAITGGLNMNSPKQKAEFLYDILQFPERVNAKGKPMRTSAGGRKTDKTTLQWLSTQATTDEQKQFVELQMKYSQANAALSKNLEFFEGVCREYGGKFHAQFNQTVAATHRLTSSGMPLPFEMHGGKEKSVQFQNMPREFKGCFTAPEDYYIVEVDGMQLEFRVAAYCGDDKQAYADIADPDFDAHCRSASVINEIPYEAFLADYRRGVPIFKAMRQDAKADTFKPLYGGKKGTPGQERYYESFNERYSDLVKQQENWLAEVEQEGKFRTEWGMVFTFDCHMNRHGTLVNSKTFKPVGPQVFNYPVQNLATAEIVPIAITALYRRCRYEGLDVKFVNTVHDSVICYVHRDHIGNFCEQAGEAFTTDVYEHLDLMYRIEFPHILGAEVVFGEFWNEGEEFVHDDVVKEAA